jgi:hypothetical protein
MKKTKNSGIDSEALRWLGTMNLRRTSLPNLALLPTDKWNLNNPATYHEIEGYASAPSVNLGESISFYVNTTDGNGNATAMPFNIDIYRMGYYGGLGAALIKSIGSQPGQTQQLQFNSPGILTQDGLSTVECQWQPSYTLQVPKYWPSGVYIAKLTADPPLGEIPYESFIIFVVRDDANKSDLLFQCSVNTYHAYNLWGGKNLYGDVVTGYAGRSYAVSFNRPYDRGNGTGDFFFWEYPMIRWLERNNYNVTYTTDVDMARDPNPLLSHKALLVVGHGEYWSWQMRNNVETALQAGVSLGFFGANMIYWQVRLQQSQFGPGPRVLCYKDSILDPVGINSPLLTVTWRDPLLNRPEQTVVGQMYGGDLTGKICTKWNERESTWRKSRSCPSRGTSQSKL